MSVSEVLLWGKSVGAISWLTNPSGLGGRGYFEYTPSFNRGLIQPAPLMMPLKSGVYSFPDLPQRTFKGLPGMLADALPDRWGNALIDQWLSARGLLAADFDPVARLSYLGNRAMGALEFKPALGPKGKAAKQLSVHALVELAAEVLQQRNGIQTQIDSPDFADLIRVGTSAGGARAKAVIAWNPRTQEVRSGHGDLPTGFEHWLIKFDDVGSRDHGSADPAGMGALEYSYFLLARQVGITMMDCRLHVDGARRHFMTRRFDRLDGQKWHAQTLAAMAHMGIDDVGIYGYETLLAVMQKLPLEANSREQMVRRIVFNLVARNQDDHCKNFGFLMDAAGQWRLAPAYDLGFAFDPQGRWTSQHQLALNGKRDQFTRTDVATLDQSALLPKGRSLRILDEVMDAFAGWPQVAKACDVPVALAKHVAKHQRLAWV
jgi:serine/threonine-protein kinase HipA